MNQCVLMEGLDTPCPSESAPVPLKRLPVPGNEFVSGRAFSACEAPSQGKTGSWFNESPVRYLYYIFWNSPIDVG